MIYCSLLEQTGPQARVSCRQLRVRRMEAAADDSSHCSVVELIRRSQRLCYGTLPHLQTWSWGGSRPSAERPLLVSCTNVLPHAGDRSGRDVDDSTKGSDERGDVIQPRTALC